MTFVRTLFLLGFALQACAPRTTARDPEQSGQRESGEPNAGERKANANAGERKANASAGSCPARFDYAMHGSNCTPESACSFPAAQCHCAPRYPCSGVDPGPDVRPTFEWSCNVTDPDIRRPDGCPARLPEQGLDCADAGRVCHYSPYCGGIQSTARCSAGTWQLEQQMISAPPSAEG
jgi:hypothetical protein